MRLVILESPYRGKTEGNEVYARQCLMDSLKRGEAPLVSHLLYPQVLDDVVIQDRALGIKAGLSWGRVADATVVYVDRGISDGMRQGIEDARLRDRHVEVRSLSKTQPIDPIRRLCLECDLDYRGPVLCPLCDGPGEPTP